jgi:hypothetical protein
VGPSRFNRLPAPTLGQHNAAILSAIGCGVAELDDLEARGVIGTEPKMG